MRFSKNLSVKAVALLLLVALMVTFVQPIQANAASNAKVHYLNLNSNTLSVLVECNGKFGMIDSGEDTDYPDGSDPRYPDRGGTTKGIGYEKEVIAYLKSVGVNKNNFEFYIGTHVHSDHVGSADEIIREFTPKRVYMQEYKDAYITNPSKLWDNLYVYDNMMAAVNAVGSELIQNINSSNAVFTLGGDLKISIKNYGDDYKTNPTDDANDFSLGVLLEANGKSVFVGGDINNFGGDENKLINELGHVDVLTLGHHGCYGSNSYKYVTSLAPQMMILAGDGHGVSNTGLPNDKSVYDMLMEMGKKGVPLYITGSYENDMGAIVINFDSTLSTNIPKNSKKIVRYVNVYPKVDVTYINGLPVSTAAAGDWLKEDGRWWYRHADGTYSRSAWEEIMNEWYYFDAEGWMVTGWIQLDGLWYYLNPTEGSDEGKMVVGWVEYNGNWYYMMPEDGYMLTGVQTIDGKTYYFNADGAMQTGWHDINGKQYYFNADGVMQKDTVIDGKKLDSNGAYIPTNEWVTEDGRKWYRHADGSYTTNDWEQIGGKWYFFDDEGWMVTGWIQWDNIWYYLNPNDGIMVTGLQKIDGKTYYFDSEGAMLTGMQTIGGKTYYFNGDGVMQTGWQTISGKTHYFGSDGVMLKNTTVDGKKIDSNGVYIPTNEWVTEDGRKWYRHADGSYTTNDWEQIGGKWYFFDAEGWMKTGWITWKNAKYYLNPSNGVMVTGWNTISSKTYYFNSDGVMLTGWQTISGKTYYFGTDGAMRKNTTVDGKKLDSNGVYTPVSSWVTEGSRKWYRHADGSYTTNNWEKINGKWYFFDEEGWMVTGWIQWKGVWYYLNPSNGVMVTGWKTVDGKTYYFDSEGAMLTGWIQLSGKWYYLDASGARVTGWLDLNGTWYYLNPSNGVMATNTWVDGYYVNADGVWVQ